MARCRAGKDLAALLALIGLLLAAGCGSGPGKAAGSSRSTARAAATTVSSSPSAPAGAPGVPQPGQRCGPPDVPALTVRFASKGGVMLDGAIVGSGPVGVVLLEEYPGPLCGWWPYAVYLAQHRVHALLFDFSCLGLSGCPRGRTDPVADTAAAMRELRAHGAHSVALVGGSFGAGVAVLAGTTLHPAAVVDLSGERDLTALAPGVPLNSYRAAPALRAPGLFVVAQDDPYVSVADMRAIEHRASSAVKQLIVLPPTAGHGWDMLSGSGTSWVPLAHEALAFVLAHPRR